MKFSKTLFVIFVLVLLGCSGCSTVKFGYNHGDWILRYWVYGYTSFNPQQKEYIRHEIADYMRWHRKAALPEYIAFLQNLNATARQDALNADDVRLVRLDMNRLYRLTMTPAIRPAAHILSTLDKGQIEKLRISLLEQNREEREESLSGSEQEKLEKRSKKYSHFFEDLVGHLSYKQKDQIRQMSMHIPFVTESYIKQRESRQATLIAMLNEHASEDKINALLTQWINKPVVPLSTQARQSFEDYDNAMNDMIVRIFGLLTAQQKEHLHKKISGYIDDLQQLHAADEAVDATTGNPDPKDRHVPSSD